MPMGVYAFCKVGNAVEPVGTGIWMDCVTHGVVFLGRAEMAGVTGESGAADAACLAVALFTAGACSSDFLVSFKWNARSVFRMAFASLKASCALIDAGVRYVLM